MRCELLSEGKKISRIFLIIYAANVFHISFLFFQDIKIAADTIIKIYFFYTIQIRSRILDQLRDKERLID